MSSLMKHKKFSTMCRLCMDENVLLVNIHPTIENPSTGNILEVIETFTTIKIEPMDNLPQLICENCIQTINSILAFRNKCKRNNKELHKMLQNVDEMIDSKTVIEILDDSDRDTDTNEKFDANENGSEILLDQDNQYEYACNGETEHNYPNDLDNINDTDESEARRYRPPEKVACHICGKLFENYFLQFHINQHNGLKPFECDAPNCTSRFIAPHYLSRHKKLCHVLKPILRCDVCGRGFKVKVGLDMHRSYHFDPKLPCSICEKLFRNKRALSKHMLVHTQERKFKCDVCLRSFQTRYTLRIHKRVHTQEKPYLCQMCGVSFAYNCLLNHTVRNITERRHWAHLRRDKLFD